MYSRISFYPSRLESDLEDVLGLLKPGGLLIFTIFPGETRLVIPSKPVQSYGVDVIEDSVPDEEPQLATLRYIWRKR
jgi:hypothetical protein